MESEPVESDLVEAGPIGAAKGELSEELPQLEESHRWRRVNAYDAIRQADEDAEAIALEQTPRVEQSQSSHTPSSHATPVRDEISYSKTHPPISRTAAYPLSDSQAYKHSVSAPASASASAPASAPTQKPLPWRRLSKLWPWKTDVGISPQTAPFQTPTSLDTHGVSSTSEGFTNPPAPTANGRYAVDSDGRLVGVHDQVPPPIWWKQQPYAAIAHLFALSGTFVAAWIFGILVAQLLPGNFAKPPLQESLLRKSSRLAKSLWHFPQLWQSQTTEIRIEAIPIPDTGPITRPISLPPLERQPLIDELNAIETDVLTIDRRIEILEKQLGRPPYEGADIGHRVNSLRGAIDPPVNEPVKADYQPEPVNPSDRLLEVAERKITLPADALFIPGQSQIKDADMLNPVLDQLVNYPGARVVVRSYSDNQASAAASREYTLAQANALSQYLRKALPEEYRPEEYRWITIGGGDSQAISANETAPGRQRNRRIEILIDTR